VEIRDARHDEADTLRDLHRRSSLVWEEHRAVLLEHPELFGVPAEAITEGRVRVAVADEALVGFAVVAALDAGAVELDDLFVDPDRMRSGIGRLLVDDLEARARATGAIRVEVTANLRARGFYEKCGYVADRIVQTRFADALRMHHDLA
jgi:GNAT superfamily N-acetyltransferase